MYHTEPPTHKTIREWYMNSSRVTACALRNEQAVRAHRPGRPLAVEPGSTPRPLAQKKLGRDSLPIDMLLSAVSVLVVEQSSSEIPEGLMNNPVLQSQTVGISKGIKILLTDSVLNVVSATQKNAVEISVHARSIVNSSGL